MATPIRQSIETHKETELSDLQSSCHEEEELADQRARVVATLPYRHEVEQRTEINKKRLITQEISYHPPLEPI